MNSNPRVGLEDDLRTQLVGGVGEETDLALAERSGIACARAVPGRVEPVLEDAVSELAELALVARAGPERWANDGAVTVLAGVAARGPLALVSVRALSPVVASHYRTPFDLVSVHSEFIGAVYSVLHMTTNTAVLAA